MPLDFTFMFLINLIFSFIPLIGIILNKNLYSEIAKLSKKNVSIHIYLLITAFLSYTIFLKFKSILYDRYIIQFHSLLKFEKKIKLFLHETCSKLELKEYNDTAIYKKTFEARVASINIYRLIEVAISLFTVFLGIAGISSYFIKVKPIYLSFVFLGAIPTLVEKYLASKVEKKYRVQQNELKRREETYLNTLTQEKYIKENKVVDSFSILREKWLKDRAEEKNIILKSSKELEVNKGLSNIISTLSRGGALLLSLYYLKETNNFGEFSSNLLAFSSIEVFSNNISSLSGYLGMFSSMIIPFFDFIERIPVSKNDKHSFNKKIELKNITFNYNGKDTILNNISFSILKGEKVAIVGSNGSGKSTLGKILLGLYQPLNGQIFIDNKEIKQNEIWKNNEKSAIFQDFFKYPITLAENITMGHDHKDKKIDDFLKKVGLTSIKKETKLGKTLGYREVSGGQWQRIAIARGFYKDSNILFLDEPSSAVDILGEKKISSLLEEDDRTKVIITHKDTFLPLMDKIIFLKNGEIIKIGKHKNLIKTSNDYKLFFEKN